MMASYEEEVQNLRKEINKINVEIIEKLAERVEVALKIGDIKRKYGIPIVDTKREAIVYAQISELAIKNNIDPEAAKRAFKEIIRLCTEAEEQRK